MCRLSKVGVGRRKVSNVGFSRLALVACPFESTVVVFLLLLIVSRRSSRARSKLSPLSSSSAPWRAESVVHVRTRIAETSPSLIMTFPKPSSSKSLSSDRCCLDARRSSAAEISATANSPRSSRKKSLRTRSKAKTLDWGSSFCNAFLDSESRMAEMAADKLEELMGEPSEARWARCAGSSSSSGDILLEKDPWANIDRFSSLMWLRDRPMNKIEFAVERVTNAGTREALTLYRSVAFVASPLPVFFFSSTIKKSVPTRGSRPYSTQAETCLSHAPSATFVRCSAISSISG